MELPSGTVTLLFTDIEGSTALAERAGDRWPGLLAEHNRLLREAFSLHGGIELGAEGDALFVAFTSAGPAATAAAAAQRALASHPWPEGEVVRVRMGLHTGEPTPTPDGYVGLDMHRAARVAAAAHGGQVLLSQPTRDLLSDIADGLTFRDLGDHRLKDLSGPQRLHQLCIEGLTAEFPPPRTIEGRTTNLPAQPTPLVGRDLELEAVRTLLREETTRMVTLTGPGGTGKTRLALQVAADLVDEFPDGVYGVLLAPISDPDLVPLELARVLGVEESSSLSLTDALQAELKGRRTLILFDNFEHVGAAAELLATLLGACHHLKVLVTSREPLRIAAERQYPVPPLTESEAVVLFVERARALRPDFELTDEAAPLVAELCERLDRLPRPPRPPASPSSASVSTGCRSPSSSRLRGRKCSRPLRCSGGSSIGSSSRLREGATCPRARAPFARRSRGAMTCSRTRSAASTHASRCSWAVAPSRLPSASPVRAAGSTPWRASPRSSIAASSERPRASAASRASRCSRRFASSRASTLSRAARRTSCSIGTRSSSPASPTKPTPACGATISSSGSSAWRSSTTTCAPRSNRRSPRATTRRRFASAARSAGSGTRTATLWRAAVG